MRRILFFPKNKNMVLIVLVLALAAAMPKMVLGQSLEEAAPSTPVVVVVKVPAFPGLDRAQLEAAMVKSVPIYKNLPGLIRKYFVISE